MNQVCSDSPVAPFDQALRDQLSGITAFDRGIHVTAMRLGDLDEIPCSAAA